MKRRLVFLRDNAFSLYGIAVLFAIVALIVRLSLSSVLGHRATYLTFFFATAGSAAIGGFKPGMVTAVCSVLLAAFVLPSGGWAHLTDPTDPFAPLRFLLSGAFVSYLCEVLISSKERAEDAERRVQESERIYRAIGESIPFGTWICSPDGRNTYASEAILKLTGMTQTEWSEYGWARTLHPDDRARIMPLWEKCVRDQGTWDGEMRYLGVDGKYHPILSRGVPVRDDQGNILCWAGINLDISNLKKVEGELRSQASALERSNRDLEQFAFVASHDMQEPLRTVNTYTELLLRRLGDQRSPELDQFVNFVHEGVARMNRLIQDLLSFSRIIHADTVAGPVDTNAAVQEAILLCDELIQESKAGVAVAPLPVVTAERAHVTQVFQNLFSNAIKYAKPGVPPLVQVSAEQRNGHVLIRVSDNGIGFDPQYSEKVFKLFARLGSGPSSGTGLGLAICHRIVERYGGKIWAESKPGEGSTFLFTLPN